MKKIGIVGGGQLGKMMILDAKKMDYYFVILDPTEHCPAHGIADEHIVAKFDDKEAMLKLAEKVDVVTYEFEHISVEALKAVEAAGTPVYPSSETLHRIQNKYHQKDWLRQHGIPVPDFMPIHSFEDMETAGKRFGYPQILKTCTGGYDGKGNAVIQSPEEKKAAYDALGAGKTPLMIEEYIPFQKEVSILVCQSLNGQVEVFPVAENLHRNSILDETMVPADILEETREKAFEIARKTSHIFKAIGMLCIEMFVTEDGEILVNELAPRPHNSGHYTIEGCYTSQYENHIRAILGLPLGSTALIRPTVMKNIIGNKTCKANLHGLEKAYTYPSVQVHLYGKEEVKVGRKMGHITVTADTLEAALAEARYSHSKLYFSDEEE